MNQKNFVIEVLDGDGKRVFIVRELPMVPNAAPIPRVVSPDIADIVDFLKSPDLFGTVIEN